MSIKRIYPILILITLIVLLSDSCSFERRIAREFIKNDSTRTVLVMKPDFIFKKSLKEYNLDGIGVIDNWTIDSILWTESIFLQYIDDSLFLGLFVENYIAELKNLGFKVYGEDSLMTFLSGKKDAYIVNLAQMEIEEYVMPIQEEEQFGDYLYYEVVDLNAINLNSWFEINRLNQDEDKLLFFASHYLTDDLEGYFKQFIFSGEVQYRYHIDTLQMESIYQLAALAGYQYAGYTFDYLLNEYIDAKMYDAYRKRSDTFYHYNSHKRWLEVGKEDERFILME